ncbi:MAG: GNAT family N-acetyltransferase [Bacteroidota bacterium]
MEKEIELRLAHEGDLSLLEKIGDSLFDFPVKPERALEFLKDHRHHLMLAFVGGQLVGMASGFHYVHPDKDSILFVNEVSVLDSFRNRGIARKMVGHLVSHGKDLGCAEAWVATEASNVPARKAYKAAGGVEEEEPIVLIEFE